MGDCCKDNNNNTSVYVGCIGICLDCPNSWCNRRSNQHYSPNNIHDSRSHRPHCMPCSRSSPTRILKNMFRRGTGHNSSVPGWADNSRDCTPCTQYCKNQNCSAQQALRFESTPGWCSHSTPAAHIGKRWMFGLCLVDKLVHCTDCTSCTFRSHSTTSHRDK